MGIVSGIAVNGLPSVFWDPASFDAGLFGVDGTVRFWKEANGTINMMLQGLQSRRMQGTSFETLGPPAFVYSSIPDDLQALESGHGYWNFLGTPYTLDGVTIYSLAHAEWYAGLISSPQDFSYNPTTNVITQTPTQMPNGNQYSRGVLFNSWTTTVNHVKSTDGGATWAKNTVGGDFTVADVSYVWTGGVPLANRAYLYAVLYTGLQQIGRVLQEGSYYYSIGNFYHRDMSLINPGTGFWQAPLDVNGLVLIRTTDPTTPIGWETWTSGSTWVPITDQMVMTTFLPSRAGVVLPAAPNEANGQNQFPGPAWAPDWIHDTVAEQYIIIFRNNTTNRLCYFTTPSLAMPVFSDYADITGTEALYTGSLYHTVTDPTSAGFSYEFTTGQPDLFYTVYPGGKVYRVQLVIDHGETAPVADFSAEQVLGTLTYQLTDLSV